MKTCRTCVQGRIYNINISLTMRIVKFTLLSKLFVLHHLSLAADFQFDRPLHVECTIQRNWGWDWGCALWGWGGDGSQMYGDGVGSQVYGDGVGMEKNHGDGMGWEWG